MLEDQVRRGADRYVGLVKAALLGEGDLTHELRAAYLHGDLQRRRRLVFPDW